MSRRAPYWPRCSWPDPSRWQCHSDSRAVDIYPWRGCQGDIASASAEDSAPGAGHRDGGIAQVGGERNLGDGVMPDAGHHQDLIRPLGDVDDLRRTGQRAAVDDDAALSLDGDRRIQRGAHRGRVLAGEFGDTDRFRGTVLAG